MLLNCPSINEWHKGVPRSVRTPAIVGILVLLMWGGGFGIWATTAPLDGAVVASGTFVATGQNKQIQHFEGGIVREIVVAEGELVEPGDVLMRLDETNGETRLRRLEQRRYRLLATEARLEAQRQGWAEMVLPPKLADASAAGEESLQQEIAKIITGQEVELSAHNEMLEAQSEVMRKEIAGLEESIEGYQAQIDATRRQLEFFREEVADKQSLMDQQLIRKSDLLAVQRAESRLAGELGQLISRVADSRERIARANQQIVQLRTAAVQKAVEELRATESELDDLFEQIRAAKDVVARLEVAAPVRGIVVKMNYHTAGGVVAPGATILELLPVNDKLLIETFAMPTDITHLGEGQEAQVKLSALNHRLVPMIKARVSYVSADAIQEADPRKAALNPAMAAGAFVVRIELDEEDLRDKAPDFQPVPGMPADVFIRTGQRTFFEYLLRPLMDSFSRAFRES